MILTGWRIVKRKHAKTAFSGEGARLYGGRWNHSGVPLVYTAGTISLAVLEMLVHLDSTELLQHYVIFEVTFDSKLVTPIDPGELPKNWRAYPPPHASQKIGDAWAKTAKSAVLGAPSVVVPSEKNYLLNPRHADFPQVRIHKSAPFQFDPRLVE